MKHSNFLHKAIFFFAVIMGIELGAAIFVTCVVFPMWASSPEAATGWLPSNTYYLEEGDVFMYTSSLSLLASLAVLIAGWRAAPPLRTWLRMATLIFIIVFIWSVLYFIPIQDNTFKGEAGLKISREKLESGLKMFVLLNYVRIVMVFASFIMAIHMVGLSYRMRNKTYP